MLEDILSFLKFVKDNLETNTDFLRFVETGGPTGMDSVFSNV